MNDSETFDSFITNGLWVVRSSVLGAGRLFVFAFDVDGLGKHHITQIFIAAGNGFIKYRSTDSWIVSSLSGIVWKQIATI